MPFLSPSGSPSTSPRSKAVYKIHDAKPNDAKTSTAEQQEGPLSITYIPPLIDGSCGTTPNLRRPFTQQLSNDISHSLGLLPSLLHGAVAARMNISEVMQHSGLALLETNMLFLAMPLWLLLPGALFAAWVVCCGVLVMGMSWSLNGRGFQGQVIRSPAPAADGWTIGQEVDDEQWFYVGGMGTSSKSLTRNTLPALATLFSRTIMAVHEPTYGLIFDFLFILLQRCLNTTFPSIPSHALYTQVRTTLLDSTNNRTVILAHNVGAITVAHILRQLYADVPPEKMSKLEIYTFGAAAMDFATPLGGQGGSPAEAKTMGKQQIHSTASISERRGPHIEHFAFSNDPFARMGVLRSVHEDLAGRFCGSIFVLHCPGAAHHAPATADEQGASKRAGKLIAKTTKIKVSSRPLMSLNDYMSCLFPDHSLTSGGQLSASQQQQPLSILDNVMTINRSLAEKREFAALAKDPASHATSGASQRRRSWTGLGATASGRNGNMDGVMGLEIARKGCRDCSGHRGREVSRLVNYVCIPSQFNDIGDRLERKNSWKKRV